jgi:endoglucanase
LLAAELICDDAHESAFMRPLDLTPNPSVTTEDESDAPPMIIDRRHVLAWLTMGGAALAGCGGESAGAGETGIVVVPAPAPVAAAPTPTPAPAESPPAATPAETAVPASAVATALFARGVSLSTIEGTPDTLPGHLNGEVFVTPVSHFAYYASVGMDHVRLEASWERMQPRVNGELGEQLLDHYADPNNPLRNPVNLVKYYLDTAQKNNLKVILDLCHNYGERYVGYDGSWAKKSKAQLGSAQVPIAAFADYCGKIVKAFGSHPAVVGIELMNEPHDLAIGESGWRSACQAAIDAIRRINTTITIVVDGYGWASAEFWPSRNPTLHTLNDPSKKIIWSAHQYFDASSAGVYGGGSEKAPANANLGAQRVAPFIKWLADHGFAGRGHMGEFGAPDRDEWMPIVDNFLKAARAAGLQLTAHQDIAYANDGYTMNLFPTTNAAGVITGADRRVVRLIKAG